MASLGRSFVWRAVPLAALAAAIIHWLTNMILSPVLLNMHATPLLRYNASLLLGEGVLVGNDTGVYVIGAIVQYLISLALTLIIALVVHRWGLLVGIFGGAILGLAFYVINYYVLTLLFPWFFALHNTVLVIAHILFGAVAGGVYELLDNYDRPLTGVVPQ